MKVESYLDNFKHSPSNYCHVQVYCTIMVIVLIFNSMFIVLMNFLPGIFVLMEDESKLHGFTSFVMREKASNLARIWKQDRKKQRKAVKGIWLYVNK